MFIRSHCVALQSTLHALAPSLYTTRSFQLHTVSTWCRCPQWQIFLSRRCPASGLPSPEMPYLMTGTETPALFSPANRWQAPNEEFKMFIACFDGLIGQHVYTQDHPKLAGCQVPGTSVQGDWGGVHVRVPMVWDCHAMRTGVSPSSFGIFRLDLMITYTPEEGHFVQDRLMELLDDGK